MKDLNLHVMILNMNIYKLYCSPIRIYRIVDLLYAIFSSSNKYIAKDCGSVCVCGGGQGVRSPID